MKVYRKESFIVGLIGILLVILAPSVWALTPVEVTKLIASDGTSYDIFGVSVAVDGDTALIGASYGQSAGESNGSAYVFTRNAGVWTEQAKLTASDGATFDYFGASVALDGDTALIGAYGDDNGSVYIFTRSAGVWTERTKLTASDGIESNEFGHSVALDGDTALIGDPVDDDNGVLSGSVYVFINNAGMWTERAKLTASDGAAYDYFGGSIALDGETALIGAPNDDYNGSAYVFTKNAGVWNEKSKLNASDGSAYDYFGGSVALDGDTAIIGARFDDDNGTSSGSAYIFTSSTGNWSEQSKLTASDGAEDDKFGFSVTIDGDTALIGAIGEDKYTFATGSAYIFSRSGGVWSEQAKLAGSNGALYDGFGYSVAVDNDTALIGAPGDGVNGFESGSTYVFSLNPDNVVTIDIKPRKESNIINLKSGGFIPVAILTESEFDALQVDPDTTKFGPSETTAKRYKVKDVDRDGNEDLLLYFRIQQTGIACSDSQAILTGKLYEGTAITGNDSIQTKGCK